MSAQSATAAQRERVCVDRRLAAASAQDRCKAQGTRGACIWPHWHQHAVIACIGLGNLPSCIDFCIVSDSFTVAACGIGEPAPQQMRRVGADCRARSRGCCDHSAYDWPRIRA
eukprot:5997211-Pleurochrysis_carterae.AAC.3